jgi:hypothetical protein
LRGANPQPPWALEMTAPNLRACSVARWVNSEPDRPGGKAEVVLDPSAGARLASRGEALDHQGGQALGRRVDGRRQAGGARAEDDDVEGLLIDLGAEAELVGDLLDVGRRSTLWVRTSTGHSSAPMPSRSSSAWLSASVSMSCQLNGTRLRPSNARIAKASPEARLPISRSFP